MSRQKEECTGCQWARRLLRIAIPEYLDPRRGFIRRVPEASGNNVGTLVAIDVVDSQCHEAVFGSGGEGVADEFIG